MVQNVKRYYKVSDEGGYFASLLLILYCFCLNFILWNNFVLKTEPSTNFLLKLFLIFLFIFWKRQIAHKWYRRRYDDFDWKRRPFAVLLPNLLLLYCFCLNFYFWNISILTSEPSVDILSKLDLNINENIRFNARLIRTNVKFQLSMYVSFSNH